MKVGTEIKDLVAMKLHKKYCEQKLVNTTDLNKKHKKSLSKLTLLTKQINKLQAEKASLHAILNSKKPVNDNVWLNSKNSVYSFTQNNIRMISSWRNIRYQAVREKYNEFIVNLTVSDDAELKKLIKAVDNVTF